MRNSDFSSVTGKKAIGNREFDLLRIVQTSSLLVVLPIVWEFGVRVFDVPPAVLPAPSDMVSQFLQEPNFYLSNARFTITIVLAGFVIATVTGFIAGVCIFYIKFFRTVVYPFLTTIYLVPKVAFAPAIIIWLGVGASSALALATLIAFFPILINTFTGLQSVDDAYVEMVRGYNDSRLFVLRKIRLPAAAPQLVSGLKLSMIYSIVGVIVAEFLGSSQGIGHLIIQGTNLARTIEVFTGIAVVAVITMVLYGLIVGITNQVVYW